MSLINRRSLLATLSAVFGGWLQPRKSVWSDIGSTHSLTQVGWSQNGVIIDPFDRSTATLHPDGLYYDVDDDIRNKINVLILPPRASAVLAGYTKEERQTSAVEGDKNWGLKFFWDKHLIHVDSDESAIAYYDQLTRENPEYVPCLVNCPN